MAKTWSCGVRTLPATILGDPPIPTVAVLWMCNGFVVGATVFEGPSVSDLQLRQSFNEALARPTKGAPTGRPRRVRVASDPLARRLRNVLPKVYVDVRPTPEIDEALEAMAASFSGPLLEPEEEFMQLDESVRDELMPAALELFELQPWEVVPADVPVRVTIPGCDLPEGRLIVMGHNGDSYGLMLFTELADFELFAACGAGMLDPSGLILPKCYSLNYEPIDPEMIGADPSLGAFPLPLLTVFERDTQRPPSRSEARPMLAAIVGLSRFIRRHARALDSRANWEAGIRGRYRVTALEEKLEVRISAKL